MSSTYSGDPANSDKDAVRFYIGDTGPSFRFSDEEIVFMLDQQHNPYMAAAALCDKTATLITSGGLASKSVGGLSESYSQGSVQFWIDQAAAFRKLGGGHAVPVAHGTACMPQVFGMRQFDHPGSRSGPPSRTTVWNVFDSEEKE